MKRLFCDLDSTLNDCWRRVVRNSRNGEVLPKAWWAHEHLRDIPLPFAKTALRLFKEHGAEITILTARSYPHAHRLAEKWLKANGMVYDHLTTVPDTFAKLPVLVNLQADLYVDDLMTGYEHGLPMFMNDFYAQLLHHKIPTEVFRNNWTEILNRQLKAVPE